MILVTGGEGFIGSHLVTRIPGARPLDDRSYPKTRFDETIVMDIRRPEIFDVVRASDEVIHCACRDIRASAGKPMEDAEVNVLGTLNLLMACREFHKPFFLISSVSVHTEMSHYAISKRSGERYALLYRRWIPVTVVRLSNVYGIRDGASVIARWIAGDTIPLVGGGQSRDFTYIEDSVAGILAAREKHPEDILDIGTGIETPLEDLALWISKRMDKPVIRIEPREIDNVVHRKVNPEPMKRILGITPKWKLHDGLEDLLTRIRSA